MSGESGLSLCVCVGVCDKKPVVCYRLSLAPLCFPPLAPICWNTIPLFCHRSPPSHTLGFSLIIYHFEQLPGLTVWAQFYEFEP